MERVILLCRQGAQLLLKWADRTAYIRRPASDFPVVKAKSAESDFPEWLQSRRPTCRPIP